MQIRDRAKDLIKTGGEWISSIDLENTAIGHPFGLLRRAVIGVKHPKWQERPLLFVVCKPGHSPEPQDILAFLSDRMAKWWVPEEVIFLEIAFPWEAPARYKKAVLRGKNTAAVFDK